ncbi:hypothetical protein TRFO_31132 [Tritrichomonas foetus]|uniref:Uncharacterized protein n=1 Tax=Tritrichomonas foetus TaxID=1144522 RepID=A0A1J4JT73_9EUKA|nr:hypothetical protein TRFO_31132 [Tritrichomonas foetus]|eukprot:OHT01938.1 hypothetical protein TRFO_31132 [Tritrichomonas foetus]
MEKKVKTVQEKWPDDDRSYEFIHAQVKHLKSFAKDDQNDFNFETAKPPIRNSNIKKISLQPVKSSDYLFHSINNTSSLPYNYPPQKNIHKKIQRFDERIAATPISRSSTNDGRKVSRRIKRIVEDGIHEEHKIEFNFTPVKDSFAARSFKCYLKTEGIRSLSLLEDVPFDEYAFHSKVEYDSDLFRKAYS